MPSRNASATLIFVAPRHVARFDFGHAPARPTLFTWQAERVPGQELEQAVATALAQRRSRRDVWVLCEEFWTQALSLSAPAVSGLGADELGRALSFELESLSGMGAADSELAFQSCGQEDGIATFWVTQAPHAAVLQLQRAVHRAHGKLRGVCHPAGVPLPLGPEADGASWWRLEVWGDMTLCLAADRDGRVRSRLVGGAPGREGWRQEVQRWLAISQASRVELLSRGGDAWDGIHEGATPVTLLAALEGSALEEWLRQWSRSLPRPDCAVPLIRPAAAAASNRRVALIAAAVGLAALTACMFHGVQLKQRVESALIQADRAERPGRELADANRQIAKVEAEIKTLERGIAARPRIDPIAVLSRQRARMCAVLQALERLGSEDRVVRSMHPAEHGGLTIEGLSLAPQSADELAVGLDRALASQGWCTRGAQKSARLATPDGGPWEFKVLLLPRSEDSPGQAAVALEAKLTD